MRETKYSSTLLYQLRLTGLSLMLISGCACQTFTQTSKTTKTASPAPASTQTKENQNKENQKMSQEFIRALGNHDRNILEKVAQASASLPKDVDQAIGTLDSEARELAVELITKQDNEYTGMFLLRRTADDDANVSTLAADNIGKIINKPKTEDILTVIPKRNDPFIRGKLYLEAGKRNEDNVLEQLRRASANEDDEDAKLKALAAKVKRGGQPEKGEFLNIVRSTEPDDALKIQDLLLYIDNPSLAKGLIPWLDKDDNIMRIGSDRQNMMARMKDVAVWTAHLLKIKLPFETTSLRNYTEEEIQETRKVLELLPDN